MTNLIVLTATWVKCHKVPTMWGVKFHTSEGDQSRGTGTDGSVKMTFKVFEEKGHEVVERFTCTTNELNNDGDDHKRGSTDIYTSEILGNKRVNMARQRSVSK